MAKKACIVRIYPGGLLSAGKKDLYVVSGKDGELVEVISTPPSDGGPVIAAGYDPHDARDLEVTKATYNRYLAHAKRNPMPIPNRGPLRRRTTTKKWIGKAITRPGKLGGAGFLSKSKAAQEKILRGCVAEYGYRSCLGSVMILERIPDIQNRWGIRLAGLRHFLVRNFGGPGSFGPRRNPDDPEWTVKGVTVAPLDRDVDDALLAAMGIKSNPATIQTDPRLLEVSDLFMAGLNRKALAKLKTIRPGDLGTDDLGFYSALRRALKNPADFALVPEVSGCPLCAVKSNPTFEKAMSFAEATPEQMRAGFEELKARGGEAHSIRSSLERGAKKKKAKTNPLYGLTIPQEAVYMHFANLDLPPRQAIRQAKAMSDREAEAFMAHVASVLGEPPAVRTRAGARGARKKPKAPARRKKKNASAVLRNAMRGT